MGQRGGGLLVKKMLAEKMQKSVEENDLCARFFALPWLTTCQISFSENAEGGKAAFLLCHPVRSIKAEERGWLKVRFEEGKAPPL